LYAAILKNSPTYQNILEDDFISCLFIPFQKQLVERNAVILYTLFFAETTSDSFLQTI
jgi:hypothetical protein